MTVTELIESVRLAGAYRELSVLHPQASTVTQVALDNGFSHLGRFAVAFRQRYGEMPRERFARRTG